MAARIFCRNNVLFLYGPLVKHIQRFAGILAPLSGRGERKYSSSFNAKSDSSYGPPLKDEEDCISQVLDEPVAPAAVEDEALNIAKNEINATVEASTPWLDIEAGVNTTDGYFMPGRVGLVGASSFIEDTKVDLEVLKKVFDKLIITNEETNRFGKEFIGETNEERQDGVVKDYIRNVKETEHEHLQYFSNSLEFNVKLLPQLLKNDLIELFPGWDNSTRKPPLTAIIISYKTEHDMSEWSDEMDEERETLVTAFLEKANTICESLRSAGFRADYIDPNTGKPSFSPSVTDTLSDMDERYQQFGFTIEDLGCCKVMKHSVYGTNVFVGAVFSSALPSDPRLQRILNKSFEDLNKTKVSSPSVLDLIMKL